MEVSGSQALNQQASSTNSNQYVLTAIQSDSGQQAAALI